jgi:ABC-type transporter Mla MlaB component
MQGWLQIERNTRTNEPLASGRCLVVLPKHCTLAQIGVLHDILRSACRNDDLDGSDVERVDSAGLRLLVAFIRERRAAGGSVGWRGASAVLHKAVSALGLTAAVNLPLLQAYPGS